MPTLAKSALQVPQSRIRELANAALGMGGVLKLFFGESSLPTPEYMKLLRLRDHREFCLAALRRMRRVAVSAPEH